MVCSVAGITSDANVLTNELRLIGKIDSFTLNFYFYFQIGPAVLTLLARFSFCLAIFQPNDSS